MEEEFCIDGNNDLPVTHYFLYKGKQFPFNMNIFKCFSQYFNSSENQYEENSNIDLLDESDDSIDISEASINDFINFCQKNRITLNRSNILTLHKLAKKYMVPSLIKATNQYISSHQQDIAIDLLLNPKDNEDAINQEYERIISENLTEYFQDPRLLSLPLPTLYRIVTKYTQKNISPEKRSEFIEFLFKCLDHYGRSGSVLFEHADIGCCAGTFLHRLLNEYSEKFDFHFINDEQLRTIYDHESEIIGQTKKLSETEKTAKVDIEKLKEIVSELKNDNDTLRNEIKETGRSKDEQIQQMRDVMKNERDEMLKAIQEMNRSKDEQIQQIVESFTQMVNGLKGQIEKMRNKIDQQNGLIGQLNDQIKKLRCPKISCMFVSESNPVGILTRFRGSVSLSAGGYVDQNHPVENILIYDNSYFYNTNGGTPNSESQSYIKFDFGPSNRIDLYSYFIRSNAQSASTGNEHPKTWRIEGSNDDSHWTRLDRRENDENLYGPYKQHHFICKENHHGDESSRYRYIRYIQENSWWNGKPYYVYITYFELYGDVFGN